MYAEDARSMPIAKILVVDDEETVRVYIRRILAVHGLETIEAIDGLDALRKIEGLDEPLTLLVTDVRMPRMDGIELGRAVGTMHPETPILYISGYPFDIEEERSQHPGRMCAFLSKPFVPKKLVETVKQCLGSAQQVSCA